MYNLEPSIDVERDASHMGNSSNSLQNSVPSAPRPKAVKSSRPKSLTSRFLLQFAQRHPFICLFLTWGAMIYFGWLAATGLAYTNTAPLESPKPAPVAEAPKAPEVSRPSAATSFGLLAIVAGGCAASSVVLARQLKPMKSAPKATVRRVVIEPKPVRSRPPVSSRRPTKPITQPVTQPIPKPVPKAIARPTPKPTRPVTTVLTIEEDSPFEMRDPSLAEMLDIRQNRR